MFVKVFKDQENLTGSDRLDLQHHIFTLLLGGKLYLAPIGEPADVLDIGTGTGIWAKLFAQRHPNSRVVGTDISIIQPAENNPPNLSFVREDSEDTWIFDHMFDFIYWRMSEKSRLSTSPLSPFPGLCDNVDTAVLIPIIRAARSR